jgi:hypothetical protein
LPAGGAAACVASLGAACAGAAIGGIAAGSNAGTQCAIAAEKNNAGCFPGEATVVLPDGSLKRYAKASNSLVSLLKGRTFVGEGRGQTRCLDVLVLLPVRKGPLAKS